MDDFVVVLAGGKGERFWPASRANKPKQLLNLVSNKSMIRETIERTLKIVPIERTFIVTNRTLSELIQKDLPDLKQDNFIIEPEGKNTAPAICFAAANIIARYGDGIMFALASDHYISPVDIFIDALLSAKEVVVSTDRLVLMGIQPTRPETGYGYIQVGEKLMEHNGIKSHIVLSFREKPSRVKAQEFYLSGNYLWNSGNFIMRAGKVIEEAEKYMPDLAQGMRRYISEYHTLSANTIVQDVFRQVRGTSFDYGILEKSDQVAVLWGTFQWDDVGSWGAVERILPKDRYNNVVHGIGQTLLDESYETTVYNDAPGLVVASGVSDVVIVRLEDVVLVLNKTRIDQLRELVAKMRENPDYEKYL